MRYLLAIYDENMHPLEAHIFQTMRALTKHIEGRDIGVLTVHDQAKLFGDVVVGLEWTLVDGRTVYVRTGSFFVIDKPDVAVGSW